MKLQDQVVSLELAKQLKELGLKQESHFYHVNNAILFSDGRKENWNIMDCDKDGVTNLISSNYDCVSAYTVAELGQMLPTLLEGKWFASYKQKNGEWLCRYLGDDYFDIKFVEEKEADARAKMLIYLKKHNLIIN